MRQVIASQCSIAVFRQSSPAYVAPTLKRVRSVARTGDAALAFVQAPFSSSGTSSVSKAQACAYLIAGSTSKSQAGAYSVLQAVAKSQAGSYLILAAGVVFKSQAGTYSVIAVAKKSRTGGYVILAVGSTVRAARSSRRAPRMDGAGRRKRQTQ